MTQPSQDQGPADRSLNLGEYFLLLCLDERPGRLLLDASTAGRGVAGAVLADLARRGHVRVTRDEVTVSDPALVLTGSVAAAEPERPLAQVLQIIREHDAEDGPRDAEHWINRFSRAELRDAVTQSLEERGVVHREEGTVLWIFHRERYPEADPTPELDLRARLEQTLIGHREPNDTTWPLIALLRCTRLAHRLYPEVDKKRIREVATTPAGHPDTRDSVAEALQATENSIAEYLIATRGGASALD